MVIFEVSEEVGSRVLWPDGEGEWLAGGALFQLAAS